MPSVGPPEPTTGGETRILLLLHRRNRELLVRWLADGWTVLDAADGFPDEFDICVLDASGLDDHRETLVALKRDEEPVFLPYLLVVREETRPYIDGDVRDLVDELIAIPTTPTELGMRVCGLLRARRQSLALGEQKEREIEALARQNERLDQFASIVSHDLRNPLSVIGGSVELAVQTDDTTHLDLARDAIDRMEDLIEALLELSRQGRLVGETTPVDLETVARRAWSVVHTHGATLVVDGTDTVEADEERLHALLENLFRNSVEHGSTSSRTQSGDSVEHGSTGSRPAADEARSAADVTIHVGPLPDSRGFYVADDGPGIPEASRQKVMEHGFTTDPGGTGFGLAIVESIADAHGWSIELTESADGGESGGRASSGTPDGGARFEFLFGFDADETVGEP